MASSCARRSTLHPWRETVNGAWWSAKRSAPAYPSVFTRVSAANEAKLSVADVVVGDDARALRRVAVEADDADERRLEREKTPGWIWAVLESPPASGVTMNSFLQKFRRYASRLFACASGEIMPSWLPGTAKIGAG